MPLNVEAHARDQRSLQREFFQYDIMPHSWIDVGFSTGEMATAVAKVAGIGMGDLGMGDFSENLRTESDRRKIVGFLGKYAVSKLYGFPVDRLFAKSKKGYYDFYSSYTRILVKTSSRTKAEVVLMDLSDLEPKHAGPELIIGVNMDVDFERLGWATAWITGWLLLAEFKERAYRCGDIGKNLCFVAIPDMNTAKSLLDYLPMKEKIRSKKR